MTGCYLKPEYVTFCDFKYFNYEFLNVSKIINYSFILFGCLGVVDVGDERK